MLSLLEGVVFPTVDAPRTGDGRSRPRSTQTIRPLPCAAWILVSWNRSGSDRPPILIASSDLHRARSRRAWSTLWQSAHWLSKGPVQNISSVSPGGCPLVWLHTVATVTWPRALHRLHSGSRSNCALRVRCQRAAPYRWAKALPRSAGSCGRATRSLVLSRAANHQAAANPPLHSVPVGSMPVARANHTTAARYHRSHQRRRTDAVTVVCIRTPPLPSRRHPACLAFTAMKRNGYMAAAILILALASSCQCPFTSWHSMTPSAAITAKSGV